MHLVQRIFSSFHLVSWFNSISLSGACLQVLEMLMLLSVAFAAAVQCKCKLSWSIFIQSSDYDYNDTDTHIFFCNRLFSDLWICVAHFMGENERKYSKALLIDPLAPLTLFTNRRLKVLHSSFFRISFYESCTIFSSGHRAICLVIEWILVHQQLLCCFVSPFALLNLLHKLFFVIFF